MYCHLAAFAGFIFPFGGILGPLILWLTKKEESEWVNRNGKASLNFQISISLYTILCIPLFFIFIGFLLVPIFIVIEIVCISIASSRAARGELFVYPLSIPFLQ